MQTPNDRRRLLALLGLSALPALSLPGTVLHAQPPADSVREGIHYTVLPDNALGHAQAASQRPLVTEIFWYGCSHCHEFDPLLNLWVGQRGDSITFSRSPTVWNRQTRQHARLFHAARELGVLDSLHTTIFAEIHEQRNYLLDDSSQLDFLVAHGSDAAAAGKALASFTVDAQVRKAEALQRELKVPGIPAMVVQGRYLVNIGDTVPSHAAMLTVVEQLLQPT